MTDFFFLNFNSHFEAKKILKAKDDQKHLLWSFHVMKLFTGALNLKFLKYFSSKYNFKYINIYHNALVSWDNNKNTIFFVKFKHTFIT